MASAKRHFTYEEDDAPIHPKKPKQQLPSPPVLLNSADCDLDFNIECNGVVGYGLNEEGFGYCWSGARATVGITKGRYCFGCIVVSSQRVDTDDTALDQRNLCRLGVSRGDDAVGALGETKNSFGFGGTGKFSNSGNFLKFGDRFGVGDTIVCCIDLESKPFGSIGFLKNGKWLGTAFQFDVDTLGFGVVDSHSPWRLALFPHVLLKNVVVQMQFSVEQGLVPREGFRPWALAVADGNAVMGPSLSDPKDCELVMLVGLPASGKTTWAEKWVKEHPEKRYVLLGTNLILEQMKVPGLLRKSNYGERFDRLMDKATAMFNVILSRAANVPRNYIIDQTNVYKNARRRKLKPFADYQKIAVVVFPKPEELKRRSEKRFNEMGKEVPADALNNMIANYVLPKSKDMPHSDEYFDQVLFVELNHDESQKYLDQMKQDIPSLSNNNPLTLSCKGSSQYYAGSALQNQGNLTGSDTHRQGAHSLTFPSDYGMPNQVNAGSHMAEPRPSMNPLLGGYSNDEASRFPRENAGYSQTYNAIPTGEIGAYGNAVLGSQYRASIAGNNMDFHGRPYVENRNFQPFNYSTHGRPSVEYRDFQPDLHTPAADTSLLPLYMEPILMSRHGGLPDNMPYSGRYVEPTLRPQHGGLPDNMPYSGRYVEPTLRPQHGGLPDNMPFSGRYVEPTVRPQHGGLSDNMPYSGRYAS
ncbi:heterogeneous nuclear ribonucleoprotein U protein [Trifolium repens]|nr:heterogeneous nuclear ribonucleoprotein U protein [Trifolium repens]